MRANIIGNLSSSIRRLQKDLKELRDSDVPLVGVSAAPLDNSMHTWHANLRGPSGTVFAGGVFHFEIEFPQNYPQEPPAIKIFSDIPHPNVFGRSLCLDMLLKNKNGSWYEGWQSMYTVESVLI